MIHPTPIANKPALGAADAGMREASGTTYWESLAEARLPTFEIPLWRTYCDQIHQAWIRHCTGPIRFERTLKTDLFEEALGHGLSDFLLQSSNRLVGIDVSPFIASRASHRHPGLQTRIADTRALPFPDHAFDRIVSVSTLDHFESRAELHRSLRELVRVLAPGGQLFLTLDNPANPLIALRGLLPPEAFGHSHLLPYRVGPSLNARELRHVLEALGLKVHDVTHLMHLPRILSLHLCRCLRLREGTAQRLLRWMLAAERMQAWPTASRTGHFVAVHASA